MKKILAAALLVGTLPLVSGASAPAAAQGITIGPGGVGVDPGYREDRGYRDERRYGDDRDDRGYGRQRYGRDQDQDDDDRPRRRHRRHYEDDDQ